MMMLPAYISGPNRVLSVRTTGSPSLRDLQHRMATLILEPGNGGELQQLFRLPQAVSAIERLQVYAGGYPARLHEGLADAFPAVAHVIGPAAFHALTQGYLSQRPPLYYNINDAGAGLPVFLRTYAPSSHLPFLPDLADLEWSLVEAFNADCEPAADATQLTAMGIDDWSGVVLRLQAGMRVLDSQWPIREIWEARETPVESIDIELENRPDHVLVHRRGYAVRCESIEAGEAFALTEIKRGRTLGDVMIDLAARGIEDDVVSSWFGRWMALGLFSLRRNIAHPRASKRCQNRKDTDERDRGYPLREESLDH